MKEETVEIYLEKLSKRLKSFKIEDKYIQKIVEDIEEQIYSLISHWEDLDFRKGVLSVGLDEGMFYEPEVDIEVKCFVVATIRNSFLEYIFSDECNVMGLDKPIDENLVKDVTKEAIEYFKDKDFIKMSENIKNMNIKDVYGDDTKKYPIAWNALVHLGKCRGNRVVYQKFEKKEKTATEEFSEISRNVLKQQEKNNKKIKMDIMSGINKDFSENLIKMLDDIIKNENNVFYADCFKMITRNFGKLLKIIEILLENDKIILTSNYLIENSYIGKRSNILRAAHKQEEVLRKFTNMDFLSGLSKHHREVLKVFLELK